METQVATEIGLLQRNREPDAQIKLRKDPKTLLTELWKTKRWIFFIPVGLIAILIGRWLYDSLSTESTDDAFISGHVHVVGSRLSGTVIDVPVTDNQIVKKGDLLIKLDPRDFEVQQKVAQANATKAHVTMRKWAWGELHPNEALQRDIDAATALAADANLEQANLNLQYTEIRATEDGKVGNRAVETGQQVLPGQTLMDLVEPIPWVVANFKENQASRMRPGQIAEISVDAISGHEFKGHVDSVAPGSGATFSLLPPDNATGNFTKIVQRIPVKIVFEPESIKGYEQILTTGMSVSVTVHH